MADDVGVIVTNDRKVALKFEQFPDQLRGALVARITAFTNTLASTEESRAPGELKDLIEKNVWDDPSRIVGRVGFSGQWAKAGALEYGGANKPFKVRAHKMRLDHAWGRPMAAMEEVDVGPHRRILTQQSMPARRFARGTLEQSRATISDGLKAVVSEAVKAV